MYKVFFDNRCIAIAKPRETAEAQTKHFYYCKSKKSFENVYNLFINNEEILIINVVTEAPKKLFKHLKRKFVPIKAAGGVVLNKDGELLVIKRNGFWDLPKGKIEKNEGKKTAAIREVEEECGITGLSVISKMPKTYHSYHFKGKSLLKTTYWYQMQYVGNEELVPQTEEGITEVKWVNKAHVQDIISGTFESLKPLFIFI